MTTALEIWCSFRQRQDTYVGLSVLLNFLSLFEVPNDSSDIQVKFKPSCLPKHVAKDEQLSFDRSNKRLHVSGHIHRCALSWWQCWRKDGECRVQWWIQTHIRMNSNFNMTWHHVYLMYICCLIDKYTLYIQMFQICVLYILKIYSIRSNFNIRSWLFLYIWCLIDIYIHSAYNTFCKYTV